jgi:hypothetical protein
MSSVSNDLQAFHDFLDDLVEQPVVRPDPLAPITLPEADVEKALAGFDDLVDKANDQPKVEVLAVTEPVAADDIKAENDEIEAAVALELEVSELASIDEDEFATLPIRPVRPAVTKPASTDSKAAHADEVAKFRAREEARKAKSRALRDIAKERMRDLKRAAGVQHGVVRGGIMYFGKFYPWDRGAPGQDRADTAEVALGISREMLRYYLNRGVDFHEATGRCTAGFIHTLEYNGDPISQKDLAATLKVSERTIARYVKKGLSGDEIAKVASNKKGRPKKT